MTVVVLAGGRRALAHGVRRSSARLASSSTPPMTWCATAARLPGHDTVLTPWPASTTASRAGASAARRTTSPRGSPPTERSPVRLGDRDLAAPHRPDSPPAGAHSAGRARPPALAHRGAILLMTDSRPDQRSGRRRLAHSSTVPPPGAHGLSPPGRVEGARRPRSSTPWPTRRSSRSRRRTRSSRSGRSWPFRASRTRWPPCARAASRSWPSRGSSGGRRSRDPPTGCSCRSGTSRARWGSPGSTPASSTGSSSTRSTRRSRRRSRHSASGR